MKKEHQIIMLPSEKQQENVLCVAHKQLFFSEGLVSPGGDIMPRHLYILSDEEIKKGDWFINLGSGGHPGVAIYQANSENSKSINEFKFPEIKKIIATTDTELHYNKVVEEDMHMYKESLPHIPQHIIEAYVKKPFDKVLVEYTEIEMCFNYNGSHYGKDCSCKGGDFRKVPKTDSNNCIIIHPVEEKMYSREDMHKAFCAGSDFDMESGLDEGQEYYMFTEWIKENL